MKKLFLKPYLIFWLLIPVLLIIGAVSEEKMLDFNIGYNYFVISRLHFSILLSLVMAILGLGYWLMHFAKRRLNGWLTGLHTGFTLGGMFLIWLFSLFLRNSQPSTFLADYEYNEKWYAAMLVLGFLILVGQLLYVINLLIGLVRKRE